MENYENLVVDQQNRADDIESRYTSFKKTPLPRRTVVNIQKNLQELESKWIEFYETHQKLESDLNFKQSDYYKSNFAYKTQELYKKYKTKILEWLEIAKSSNTENQYSDTDNQSSDTENQSSNTKKPTSGQAESTERIVHIETPGVDNPFAALTQESQKASTSGNQKAAEHKPSKENNEEQSIINKKSIMSEEFQAEAKKRKLKIKHLKENIERAVEYLRENKTTQFFEQKLKQMEAYWQGILDSTDKMMGDEYDQTYEHELNAVQEEYDNVIIQINERNTSRKGMMKLPQVNLKPFDGNYHNWLAFRDLFEQMIHRNDNISTIEKFTYLQTSISGDAAQLIKHIKNTEQNYEKKGLP